MGCCRARSKAAVPARPRAVPWAPVRSLASRVSREARARRRVGTDADGSTPAPSRDAACLLDCARDASPRGSVARAAPKLARLPSPAAAIRSLRGGSPPCAPLQFGRARRAGEIGSKQGAVFNASGRRREAPPQSLAVRSAARGDGMVGQTLVVTEVARVRGRAARSARSQRAVSAQLADSYVRLWHLRLPVARKGRDGASGGGGLMLPVVNEGMTPCLLPPTCTPIAPRKPDPGR